MTSFASVSLKLANENSHTHLTGHTHLQIIVHKVRHLIIASSISENCPQENQLTRFNIYVALLRSCGRDNIQLLHDFEDRLFTQHPSKYLRQENQRLALTLDEETRERWRHITYTLKQQCRKIGTRTIYAEYRKRGSSKNVPTTWHFQ